MPNQPKTPKKMTREEKIMWILLAIGNVIALIIYFVWWRPNYGN